jgi:hypothetical protein
MRAVYEGGLAVAARQRHTALEHRGVVPRVLYKALIATSLA